MKGGEHVYLDPSQGRLGLGLDHSIACGGVRDVQSLPGKQMQADPCHSH